MLIGARTAAWGGGDALPYDREVEYLQSYGVQYIETILDDEVNNIRGITLDFSARLKNGDRYCGCYNSSGDKCYWITGILNGKLSIDASGANAAGRVYFDYTDNKRVVLSNADGVNATLYDYETGTTVTKPIPSYTRLYSGKIIPLFAMRNGNSITNKASCKIYSFSATGMDGRKVLDLIPVAKDVGGTDTGFMYDKVSGQLFGNAGTEALIIGPDKT